MYRVAVGAEAVVLIANQSRVCGIRSQLVVDNRNHKPHASFMTRRNYRPEACSVCGTHVAAKAGYLYGPPWSVKCEPCSGEVSSAATQQVIRVVPDGVAAVAIRPQGFLGPDAFRAYQTACAGAKFDVTRKCQVCPLPRLVGVLKALVAAGFVCDVAPELGATLTLFSEKTKAELVAAAGRADAVDARLRAAGSALYPFQHAGVTWLASRTGGALLADQMGLGKTIQALVALPKNAPVIVACPALAKGVWAREAAKWRPDYAVTVLSDRKSWHLPAAGEIVVASYGLLPAEFGATLPGLVVLADEIHACKNPKAARTIRFRTMGSAARAAGGRTIGLTGTAMLNNPLETWAILQALDLGGEAFGNWKSYAKVMGGYEGAYGYEWGTPDSEAVGACLKRVMLRRVRSEVLPQLPVKTYREISCEIDRATSKVCDAVIAALGTELVESFVERTVLAASTAHTLPSFQRISAARKALATAKLPALLALVEEYEEQGEPVVVFSSHVEPIKAMEGREGWAIITGETPAAERTRIEDRFQAGELKGVAATIKAGGVAITLTRAAHAVFVDRDWTPALNDQAEDRVCRIGQTRGCLITILVADHTLDQRIAELLGSKSATIEATVEQGRQKPCTVHLEDCATCTELGAACAAHALIASASKVPTVDLGALAAQMAAVQATENSAKAEAERIAAEREKHFAAERAKATAAAEEKAAGERKAKAQAAARKRAERAGLVAPVNAPDRHLARTARQVWAASALVQLMASDPDHAAKRNGVGFNKGDGVRGHWLAGELELGRGLTPRQWGLAAMLCAKYHGQVGQMPSKEGDDQEETIEAVAS